MSKFLFTCLFFIFFLGANAQNKPIKGKTQNGFTKEVMPYTSVFWKKSGFGVTSDSVGLFTLMPSKFLNDTMVISYVGYQDAYYPFNPKLKYDSIVFVVELSTVKTKDEVVVKSKFSKGLRWWKNVVSHKPENNPYKYNQYSCEVYNKLELDLNNANRSSFESIKLLKPFSFLLDNIDSVTDTKPFLPVFLTESISDLYVKNKPYKSREIIKAAQTNGIKNESILQFIGGVHQKINVYENQVKLFTKEFISPLSDVGDKYYYYKGADTQTIGNEKYFHLFFKPLRDGENVFTGECWIHSKSWAVQRITINLPANADINFVNRMSIVQEFKRLPSGQWIFAKDKVVVDVSPLKKDKLTFIGRKTATYDKHNLDVEAIEKVLALNKRSEEVELLEDAKEKDKAFWEKNRHEELTVNEKKVYKMIDTLKTIPLFKKYVAVAEFLVDGHKKFGPIEIGPWTKWISANPYEGLRLRFDLGTTEKFNKYLRLSGYMAYGFKDAIWKGKFGIDYKFKNIKGFSIGASYTNDLDNGRIRFSEDDATIDNVFNQLLRRKGIPIKFINYIDTRFTATQELGNGLTIAATLHQTEYDALQPLPSTRFFSRYNHRNAMINTEALLRFRFAPGEKKITNHRKSIRIRGDQPIYEFRIGKGFNGLLNGGYDYTKINLSIAHKFRIPRWGQITMNVYGGRFFGKDSLPFPLLELHPGNEFYTYNKTGFNLMNRFEYFSDKFCGFEVEHNVEKKLLNLLPFMRKNKIRQFWNIKGVWGDLTAKNRKYNQTGFSDYQLRSLRGHTYMEFGTGFDNIFKFFRIDFVWRKNIPVQNQRFNQPIQNFGVFGSLRVQF
ncbi:MAG: DUF5686 family protein [Chitinophagaceae bacterium]